MDSYRWLVAGHILVGILLVGQALFWAIMLLGLRREFDVIEAARWLSVTQTARPSSPGRRCSHCSRADCC
jgi:hypothetical protein